MKINHRGWKVPPSPPRSWIIGGGPEGLPTTPQRAYGLPGNCAVVSVGGDLMHAFLVAYDLVLQALKDLDLRRNDPNNPILAMFRANPERSVGSLVAEMQERADRMGRAMGLGSSLWLPPQHEHLKLVGMDLPDSLSGYEEDATDNGLLVMRSRPLTDLVTPHRQFMR